MTPQMTPSRGEIWIANLDPVRGHEQAGERPVLIVSTDQYNRGPADLVFVLPLTRTDRHIPIHVAIEPPEGGIRVHSVILCDALRSVAKERLGPRPWGSITSDTMAEVEKMMRILLKL